MRLLLPTLVSLMMPMAVSASSANPPVKTPEVCKCDGKTMERLRKRMGSFGTPSGAVHVCDTKTGAGCEIDVPVLVDPRRGTCLGYLPYCVLCVSGPTVLPPKHQPVWRLTENGTPSTNFRFDPVKGIMIPGAKSGGKVHFDGPGYRGGNVVEYQWHQGKDKRARLDHDSFIEPLASGDKRKKCSPYDPIIINTD
jgi:hypothetical protein